MTDSEKRFSATKPRTVLGTVHRRESSNIDFRPADFADRREVFTQRTGYFDAHAHQCSVSPSCNTIDAKPTSATEQVRRDAASVFPCVSLAGAFVACIFLRNFLDKFYCTH